MKLSSLTLASSLFATLLIPSTKALAQPPAIPTQTNTPLGCLSGYPDRTYRGDRPMTRYEFAAGLNACLEQVDQSIRLDREQFATKSEFDRLIQQQRSLNDELQGISDRLDTLSK